MTSPCIVPVVDWPPTESALKNTHNTHTILFANVICDLLSQDTFVSIPLPVMMTRISPVCQGFRLKKKPQEAQEAYQNQLSCASCASCGFFPLCGRFVMRVISGRFKSRR